MNFIMKLVQQISNILKSIFSILFLIQIDSGGPFTRLKVLIDTIISENKIEQLKGALPPNFW